jgi:hypothetical protein
MRQHIQLLTQVALLSSKSDQMKDTYDSCRGMLSELVRKRSWWEGALSLWPNLSAHMGQTMGVAVQ